MRKGLILILVLCFAVQVNAQSFKGKLFIIGGGSRPSTMIDRLIKEADLKSGGYGIILPMASSEPDSSIYYARKQFIEAQITNVVGMDLSQRKAGKVQLDSLKSAKLIYLPGGDQNRFMESIENSEVAEALTYCLSRGGVIAGTSAGAAVMSQVMITGDERNYPDYNETFRNIEPNNIETANGLGFIKGAIIDQHFVKRSRYNRLISGILDYPNLQGIGIDEATAIIVSGSGNAEVIGEGQVMLFANPTKSTRVKNGKIAGSNLRLDIYLDGETFSIQMDVK